MIWIDFGIICIEQNTPSIPADMKDILFESFKRVENSKPFYNDSYNFQTADALTGYWYQIWLPEPVCYEESFFDISFNSSIPWIEVVPKWEKHVENILKYYLKQSPVHKIAILLRVQDASNDIAHPYCTLDDFMLMLKEGKIKWNELYYVY